MSNVKSLDAGCGAMSIDIDTPAKYRSVKQFMRLCVAIGTILALASVALFFYMWQVGLPVMSVGVALLLISWSAISMLDEDFLPSGEPRPTPPRCPWLAGHAQCIRSANHQGLCRTKYSVRYREGPYTVRTRDWYGINYSTEPNE